MPKKRIFNIWDGMTGTGQASGGLRECAGNVVTLQVDSDNAMTKAQRHVDTASRAALARIGRLRELLRLEFEEEKEALTRIAERMDVARLIDRGWAWWPLKTGRVYYNSLNQRIAEVSREAAADGDAPDHEFDYGRPVAFFAASGTPGDTPRRYFTGTVSFVDGDRMGIAIPDGADMAALDADGRCPGVMLSFDETTYRTMFETLDALASADGRLGELRETVYGAREATSLSLPPMTFPYLNTSQQEAVNSVLCSRDVAVVHGPPGTGKTTTLVKVVYETLRRESQVLVCAQSNKAVDWICRKLADRGLGVLRIGNPSRVDDAMLESTYERRFEAHPDYPTLWNLRRAIREMHAQRRGGGESWHQKLDRLKDRAIALEIKINNEIFDSVQVIASTLTGSASRLLAGRRFATAFIDEAAQAMEPAGWIPARRADRLIFAGDHCQLPPTVKCLAAAKGGLAKSLMECVAERCPKYVTLLTVQYRMHADIMDFPSGWFYDHKLKAAPEVEARGILDYDNAVEWVDTAAIADADTADAERDFHEAVTGGNYGRVNREEARLTVDTLTAYIDRIGTGRILDERIDIGVISPYRAQVRCLRSLIRRAPWHKRLRGLVSVNTVDGFQGQERDVIIVSLVRSNDSGSIGFLRDLRRMNVAMTRARMKLILIGDSATLRRAHPFYRALYNYIAGRS